MRAMLPMIVVGVAGLSGVAVAGDDDMGRRVQALLRAHQADIFGCVATSNPRSDGEMLLRVVVGEGAQAAQVDVLEDKSGTAGLGSCVLQKARTWDLSSLGAASGDQVVFPLAFRPTPPHTSLSSLRPAPNRELTVPHEGQLALLVLAGAVRVNGQILGPEDLVWLAPRQPCRLETVGDALLAKMESSLTVPSPDKPLPPMLVVRARDRKAVAIPGGTVRLYLGGEIGVAVDLLRAGAGTEVPSHQHPGSDELLYVVSGAARTTIDKVERPTEAGEHLRIPAGTTHDVTVARSLVAVQVYAPAGPEQRYLQPRPNKDPP